MHIISSKDVAFLMALAKPSLRSEAVRAIFQGRPVVFENFRHMKPLFVCLFIYCNKIPLCSYAVLDLTR